MKFKVDENLPAEFAEILGEAGHPADTVPGENLAGGEDATVTAVCIKENRILITLDLDFADIRSYPPQSFPGFVVLRPAKQDKSHLIELLHSLLPLLSIETLQNRLWIVDEAGVRIRGEQS